MASLRRWNSAPEDLIPPQFHRSETDPMLEQEEQVKKKRINGDSDVTALTTVSSSNTNASHEEAPKKTKCRPGAGIVQDYKQTIRTHWKEEMKNLSPKTIAVGFFLFFACIAPAM